MQWEAALSVYRELASEYGGMVDASGVPVELGAEYEVAYIHAALGQYQPLVESCLVIYERLVEYRWPLPPEQRRYLIRITRQALDEILQQDSLDSPKSTARLEVIRGRELTYEQRGASWSGCGRTGGTGDRLCRREAATPASAPEIDGRGWRCSGSLCLARYLDA